VRRGLSLLAGECIYTGTKTAVAMEIEQAFQTPGINYESKFWKDHGHVHIDRTYF